MANQTFTPGIGRLAVDRYDFQNHIDGYGFQHNATAISVIPSIDIAGSPQSNVYSALGIIGIELADLALSGKGFLLVGDGFDTYHNSLLTPDTPYDSSIPAFNTYLHDVLNNPDNALYYRIRAGGIVVIKAGTYKFTGSVEVPAGIILMGEGYGTKIVNQTAGNIPLFIIKSDPTRISDNGVDSTDKLIFARETMLLNMVIADNFPEPKFLGDLTYKTPISGITVTPHSTNPLVSIKEGASLTVENMKFLGKTTYTLSVLSNVTAQAIATDTSVPVASGTRLKVVNTSMDGFAQPITFFTGGKANSNCDVTGSLIKGYGYYKEDPTTEADNAIIALDVCNANIVNNYLVGADDANMISAIYVNSAGTTQVRQGKGKITVANNNLAVDRTANTSNNGFQVIWIDGSLTSRINLNTYGNNFTDRGFEVIINGDDTVKQIGIDGTFMDIAAASDITVNSGNAIVMTAAQQLILNGDGQGVRIDSSGMMYSTRQITTGTNVDPFSNVDDYVILANTPGAAGGFSINLPNSSSNTGRYLVIKDMGSASTKNVTLVPNGSDTIEGVAANYVMDADYQSIRLIYRNNAWWII